MSNKKKRRRRPAVDGPGGQPNKHRLDEARRMMHRRQKEVRTKAQDLEDSWQAFKKATNDFLGKLAAIRTNDRDRANKLISQGQRVLANLDARSLGEPPTYPDDRVPPGQLYRDMGTWLKDVARREDEWDLDELFRMAAEEAAPPAMATENELPTDMEDDEEDAGPLEGIENDDVEEEPEEDDLSFVDEVKRERSEGQPEA